MSQGKYLQHIPGKIHRLDTVVRLLQHGSLKRGPDGFLDPLKVRVNCREVPAQKM
jgi:hypothetical protein